MKTYRKQFESSYNRAVVPDATSFYKRFYEIFIAADSGISSLFDNTFMNIQREMLRQSMTYMMSFSDTLEPGDEMKEIAEMHGMGKLNIPEYFYDIWLDCMIQTLEEFDPEFDKNVELAWRVTMAPGVAYMKTFCSR